jgi:2TM domain
MISMSRSQMRPRFDMNASEQALTRSYSQEDVQQILNIALAQHPDADTELSYAQLLEIAEELRIEPGTLKLAETKWLTQQGANVKIQEFDNYRRSKFQAKFGKYTITTTCLVALNFLMGFGVPWSLYVLIFWGMGVGLDAWKLFYQRQGQAYDRAFQNWERKQKIHKSITGLIDKLV